MVFTETLLTALTPDTDAYLEGFQLLQTDRTTDSGKTKGGGLVVFVNDRWCNFGHIAVKQQVCSKDNELLAVRMRPYYRPREITQVCVRSAYSMYIFSVYCPPPNLWCSLPQALFLISEDFNHASLSSTLPTFTHYVTHHTRVNQILDLFYANEAYSSSPLPTWCISCLCKSLWLRGEQTFRLLGSDVGKQPEPFLQ